MERATSRRRLLGAVATLGTVAAAGCGTTGDTPTGDDGRTATDLPTSVRPPASPTATPTPISSPTASPTPTPVATTLTGRGRRFLHLLDAGEYNRATDRIAEEARTQLGSGQLARVWSAVTGSVGAFQEVEGSESRPASGGTAVLLTARFADGTRVFRLVFGPGESPADRSIVGLLILEPYGEPSYVDHAAFEAEAVSVGDGCTPGRLAVPADEEAVPGVVIVHGSGPSDRDGSVGTNKPYRDLALGLATRGIAVLRYDKRTFDCQIPPVEQTIDTVVVDDAVAALDRLRSHDRVSSVVPVGHSLGGAMAPRIATRDGGVAGTVHLAANARPLYEALLDQVRFEANFDGQVTDAEQQRIAEIEAAVEQVRAGQVADDDYRLGASGAFWKSLRAYDRFGAANSLSVPAVFFQGTADWQVTLEADFRRWRTELTRADVSFRTFEGLDHLFTQGQGRPGERFVTQNVDKAVVDAVARRVKEMIDVGA